MQNYDVIPNDEPSTLASQNETLMFEVFTARGDEEQEDVSSEPEYMASEPVYAALDNRKRFGYSFRRREPLTESNPPNKLKSTTDPNSSNNPPPSGPSTNITNFQRQPRRVASRTERTIAPSNREVEKTKGTAPLDDKLKGVSYNVIEALGNTKSNLTYLEALEIVEVRQQLMGHILEGEARKSKSNPSRPSLAANAEPSPQQIQMALDKAQTYTPSKTIPPLLVTMRVFGKNLPNCMMDSGVGANIMPLEICQALNLPIAKIPQGITQLDEMPIRVVEMIHNLRIQIALESRIIIDVDVQSRENPFKVWSIAKQKLVKHFEWILVH